LTKAISLLSGGLDSILATKLMVDLGIEVEAVNFISVFYSSTSSNEDSLVNRFTKDLGIKLNILEAGDEYLELFKNPKYGYGSCINPCIDCHIFMLKKAGQYMKDSGASFLITGEVLGERPMSQTRQSLKLVETQSGFQGLILRPLSAKLLNETIPERENLVDREKLLAIQGRSRKPQMELAKKLGVKEYPAPAGGCLLTDPEFSKKMRDLMKSEDFTINDIKFLKTGRYFKFSSSIRFIVGRNEEENNRLLGLAQDKDWVFYPSKAKGPTAIGRGEFTQESILKACSIIARYSDKDLGEDIEVVYKKLPDDIVNSVIIPPIEEERLTLLRIKP